MRNHLAANATFNRKNIMNSNSPPFYQIAIQNLPFGNDRTARALGLLFGRNIKAVVNQARVTLDLREVIQRRMFLGTYEPTETAWFRQCLCPGDTFIDVGANFGHYTTLGAALVGAAGRVFAFEPSPLASKVIEDAIADSGIQNIVLKRAAVGSKNGSVSLFLPTTRHLHSPSILKSDPGFIPIEIPLISLDQFEPLKAISSIKLVKIDVEGYEPDVLDGMEQMIKTGKIKNLFCEFNSWWLEQNSTTTKQLLERFLDFGYKIHKQTELQQGLRGHQGALFDLQDIWFQLPEDGDRRT